jgi:SAM-dependent methyltransferase
MTLQTEYIAFKERENRSRYIAKRFGPLLDGKILDVGCDKAVLKTLLKGVNYTGIDIAGNPDIPLNLESISTLPFDSEYFDCVVCSDVLEHLDNLHSIFSELIRVSRKFIIISLPNNWANARKPIRKGAGAIGHYGLPSAPPPDRHKWFFGLTEAINFIKEQQKKYPVLIRDMHVTEKPRLFIVRAFRRCLYPSQERYLNRYAHTLWVVLEKTGTSV